MCYCSKTCLNSFIIGFVTSIILFYSSYKNNNLQLKILSLFFVYNSFIQLFESLYHNYNDIRINNILSIWNSFQPFVLIILINGFSNKQISDTSINSTIVYMIILILSMFINQNNYFYNHVKILTYITFVICISSIFIIDIGGTLGILALFMTLFLILFLNIKNKISKRNGLIISYISAFSPFF